MIVKSLNLKNFRNYKDSAFSFKPGINILLGKNGIGKTNVVEALHYLSLFKSFRGVDDTNLIKENEDYSLINSKISKGPSGKEITVYLTKNGRQISINGKTVNRLSEASKSLNVLLFEPKDVLLFKGPPKDRRDFLNYSLSKYSDSYLKALSRYNKVLKERNEVLKQEKVDTKLLETTTEMLIKLAAPIVNYREKYLKDINDILNKITRALTHEEANISISYLPFVPYDLNYEKNAKNAFNKALETDLRQRTTTIGVHREDYSIALFSKDIALYGSQGENRLVALALKLAPYFLIEDKDEKPIIVLDDVMSELDEKHQENLIKLLKKFEQVFITATKLNIVGATHYEIKEYL